MPSFYMTVRLPGGTTERYREDADSGADAITKALQLYGHDAQASAILADKLRSDSQGSQERVSLDPDAEHADWPKERRRLD